MPGILNTTPAMIQLTLSLYMVMLGVGRVILVRSQTESGDGQFYLRAQRLSSLRLWEQHLQLHRPLSLSVYFKQWARRTCWWRRSRRFATFMPTVLRVSSSTAFSVRYWRSCLRSALSPEHWSASSWDGRRYSLLWLYWRCSHSKCGFQVARKPALWSSQDAPICLADLRESGFWVYTVGFSAGMGTFFVFFSTAPCVLIGQAEYSEIGFSFAFATVALVMIVTTRFAKSFVARWGIAGCVARGDGVACRSGPVGSANLRLAVIPHLHPTDVGCRGRYCLHGVRYRERRFGRVRRHRGISGRVLLLRSKPDSQHCRDIGGGTFKRWHSVARDLLRHGDGGTGFVGAGAPSAPWGCHREVASRLTDDW